MREGSGKKTNNSYEILSEDVVIPRYWLLSLPRSHAKSDGLGYIPHQ